MNSLRKELDPKMLAGRSRALRSGSGDLQGLSTGIVEIDHLIGSIPRGAVTSVAGPASSGRATLMLSTFKKTLSDGNPCALIDAFDCFDVSTANDSGIDFERLLWVQCRSNIQHALNSTEIILQSGGFGLVVLDIALISHREQSSIPDNCWFRFRRAVENTLTSLIIVGPKDFSVSAAALSVDLQQGKPRWANPGANSISSPLLGIEFSAKRRKPFPPVESDKIQASLPYSIPD
jgi:recombination protein RecA